tara:strand:+ start:1172 stop:1309 length:138 start_codon:yes stop_codon:yes gene_type:complete
MEYGAKEPYLVDVNREEKKMQWLLNRYKRIINSVFSTDTIPASKE